MSQAKRVLKFAKNGDLAGGVTGLKQEAAQRGHGQQTALAGAGGLAGAVLGSFKGPLAAAFGALLGALFGALVGQRRDRALSPALPRGVRRPTGGLVPQAVTATPEEALYVDAVFRD